LGADAYPDNPEWPPSLGYQGFPSAGHEYVPWGDPCPDIGTYANANVFPEARWGIWAFTSLIDLNGDGIRDWVWTATFGGWVVYFGLGDGRFLTTGTPGPVSGPNLSGVPWDMSNIPALDQAGSHNVAVDWFGGSAGRTIDLDGDGLVDYVRTDVESSATYQPLGAGHYTGVLPANWSVWRHRGPEGLLETVTNELGGVTTIQYTPSTWITSLQGEPEAGGLPSDIVPDGRPRWVVTEVTVSDGRTGTAEEKVSTTPASTSTILRRETFGVRMAENRMLRGSSRGASSTSTGKRGASTPGEVPGRERFPADRDRGV
jgi:hypothetical protein